MHDFLSHDTSRRWSGEDAGIQLFAKQVVDVLARRKSDGLGDAVEPFLSEMTMASFSVDPAAIDSVVAKMLSARVPPIAIVDHYIPAVAQTPWQGLGRRHARLCGCHHRHGPASGGSSSPDLGAARAGVGIGGPRAGGGARG